MEGIYQIADNSSNAAPQSFPKPYLISRQESLQNMDLPGSRLGGNMAASLSKVSAFPIYTSPEYMSHLQGVSESLHAAISDIVRRWWGDPRFSKAIKLDPTVERVLKRLELEGVAWKSGSWRPDFLIEGNSETTSPRIKICEVNARFGFNGFFYCQTVFQYYKNRASPFQPALSKFSDTFGNLFDNTQPIHILKGREAGFDIHYLPQALPSRVVFAEPSQIQIVSTQTGNKLVHTVEGRETEIIQVVSELHQDEILSLSEDLLWEVSIRSRINDLRTIMLVHDKRMLAIVRQELGDLVLRGVLSSSEATLLADSIPDTLLPGTPEYQRVLQGEAGQAWLFKPASSGKGAGIVFRKDVSEGDWRALLSTAEGPHALQREVRQKVFNITVPSNSSVESVSWNLVEVHQSLEDFGLALVRLKFSDPSSDYIVSLVKDGLHPRYGHGLPINHSRLRGWLWDVKPVHDIALCTDGRRARSETMDFFPWHTDCSFETRPPRHFALHIMHADRYNGGSLSLVRTCDILQELSEEAIGSLRMPEFLFTVPGEFTKGTSESLVGSLLDMSSGESKLRYRRDIILPMTKRAEAALAELDSVLKSCSSSSGRSLRKILKAEDLPDGMVIVVDNAKWLHARSQGRATIPSEFCYMAYRSVFVKETLSACIAPWYKEYQWEFLGPARVYYDPGWKDLTKFFHTPYI
ncbi:hypothetical protein DRE_07350 [Drechslerella stenobrocha 248]|uniref:TauD/TfdA-like domain-containing protein n=1 Tax=Drechslerella stenobrocha 248 TaxID=1043628 RepID=W7I4W5_9PEZI|nr:hypothetical protein DRE_07350 [Drechslerella stenobrocha 248]